MFLLLVPAFILFDPHMLGEKDQGKVGVFLLALVANTSFSLLTNQYMNILTRIFTYM